ncbi:unnamed protein product [Microthlaspi erraticum]|uniref:Integrase catalytic domain-containing protein n=1 Tax=Microthlaspi erraticum TaxID=1685480 RepID=A0A6D2HQZ0_9BRAS|nr:unnamed protein product [Microthlaspi erraticum]
MRWAMDIVGPMTPFGKKHHQYLLVVTDYFMKWVEAKAYPKIEAVDVTDFIWTEILCRHGIPHEIVTDNGPQFTSRSFKRFYKKYKIKLTHSTPRYPQGNGQAEATKPS